MTGERKPTGAPNDMEAEWNSIDWKTARKFVRRLQARIAKAVLNKQYGKAQSLQWLLVHSFYAKALAVKRVTSNKGKRTPGIDKVLWRTSRQKMQAVSHLNLRGYRPLPLRRIYIPKKNGKLRPLSIPTMKDRAMQELFRMALDPWSESHADLNSYGFRKNRQCADAIQQCFTALAKKTSAQWVLEGDIRACFDEIDHDWLLKNIPMNKRVLRRWLKAGYIEKANLYPTKAGTPQGGCISPVLANMTLDGLETAIHQAAPKNSKVNFIRYADDFIVTGESEELLNDKVVPTIKSFLKERGLTLSDEKTFITHIEEGFNFLGQNVRKYNGKMIIKPKKTSVRSLLDKTSSIIKAHRGRKTIEMVRTLNPVIRGWTNYHRHVCSKRTFAFIDLCILKRLWRWAKRRHRNKSTKWLKGHYFRTIDSNTWCFFAKDRKPETQPVIVDLVRAAKIPIERHIKVRANTNPYLPEDEEDLNKRKSRRHSAHQQNHEDTDRTTGPSSHKECF